MRKRGAARIVGPTAGCTRESGRRMSKRGAAGAVCRRRGAGELLEGGRTRGLRRVVETDGTARRLRDGEEVEEIFPREAASRQSTACRCPRRGRLRGMKQALGKRSGGASRMRCCGSLSPLNARPLALSLNQSTGAEHPAEPSALKVVDGGGVGVCCRSPTAPWSVSRNLSYPRPLHVGAACQNTNNTPGW